MARIIVSVKGGKGSGFRGHAGRPGKRGGSAASGSEQHTDSKVGDYYSDMRKGLMGTAYWITRKDKLIDSMDRTGLGDHLGTEAIAANGKLMGLAQRFIDNAKLILKSEEPEAEEEIFLDDSNDPIGVAMQVGNIRVRVFNGTSIQTDHITNTMLHRLQDLFYRGKLYMDDIHKHYWQDLYEDNFLSFTKDRFLKADNIRQLED